MNKYLNTYFNQTGEVSRVTFDTLEAAKQAASNAKKDGYNVYIELVNQEQKTVIYSNK